LRGYICRNARLQENISGRLCAQIPHPLEDLFPDDKRLPARGLIPAKETKCPKCGKAESQTRKGFRRSWEPEMLLQHAQAHSESEEKGGRVSAEKHNLDTRETSACRIVDDAQR